MAAKKQFLFLLVLEGPGNNMPVQLFTSAEDALMWAAENPPHNPKIDPADSNTDASSALYYAEGNGRGWLDDVKGGSEPYGYAIQRFNEDGSINARARIEPYCEYDPTEGKPANGIDPKQELDWN